MDDEKLTAVFNNAIFHKVDKAIKYFFSLEISSKDPNTKELISRTPLYSTLQGNEPKTASIVLPGNLIKSVREQDASPDNIPTYLLLLKACWLEYSESKKEDSAHKLEAHQSNVLKMPLITILKSNMIKPLPMQFYAEKMSRGLLGTKSTKSKLLATADVLVVTTNVTPSESPKLNPVLSVPVAVAKLPQLAESADTNATPSERLSNVSKPLGMPNPLLSQMQDDVKVDKREDITSILQKKLEKLFSSSSQPSQQDLAKSPLDTLTIDVHDLWVTLDKEQVALDWNLVHCHVEFVSPTHQASTSTLQTQPSSTPTNVTKNPTSLFVFEESLKILIPPNCIPQGPLPDPLNAPQLVISVFNNNSTKTALFCLPVDRTLWNMDGTPLNVTLKTALSLQTGHRATCNLRVTLHINYDYPLRAGLVYMSCKVSTLASESGSASFPVAQRYIATAQIAPSMHKWKQVMEPIIEQRRNGRVVPFPNGFSLFTAEFDGAGFWSDSSVSDSDLELFCYNQNVPAAVDARGTGLGEHLAIASSVVSYVTPTAGQTLPSHWQRFMLPTRYKLPQRSLASPVTATPVWNLEGVFPIQLHDDFSKDTSFLIAIYKDTPQVPIYTADGDRLVPDLVAYAYMPLTAVISSRLTAAKSASSAPNEDERILINAKLRLQFVEPFASLCSNSASSLGLEVSVKLPSISQIRRALDSMLPLVPASVSAESPAQKPDAHIHTLNALLRSLEERIEATKQLGKSLVTATEENTKLKAQNEALLGELQRREAQTTYFTNIAELGVLTKEELEKRYALLFSKCEAERQRNLQLAQSLAGLQSVSIERNELEKQLLKLQQAHLAQQKLLLYLQTNRGKWPGSSEWDAIKTLFAANYRKLPVLVNEITSENARNLLIAYIPTIIQKPWPSLSHSEPPNKPAEKVGLSEKPIVELNIDDIDETEPNDIAPAAESASLSEEESSSFQARLEQAEAKMLELQQKILSQL